MIFLIAGTTHTGKTRLAQTLLEQYQYPYLSLDHLKMGLIRSGKTLLTPEDDEELTSYLWPIAREIIKTAIENGQNLIVEGCYIPFDFEKDFEPEYRAHIRHLWLIMSENYIQNHFDSILEKENVIERRAVLSDLTPEVLIEENQKILAGCQKFQLPYCLIDTEYPQEFPV